MSSPFKIAFIGTHGVGKTTLVYGLAARLKARDFSLEVVVEVARRCPLPLNEDTSLTAQSWILHTQVADELAASGRYPVVLCDRSVLDNYVYLLLAAGPRPELDALINSWLHTYSLLVHVPIVTDEVLPDGVRSTSRSFRETVDRKLRDELARRRLPTLQLQPEQRDTWVNQVEEAALEHLHPAQMRLIDRV